MKDPAFQANFIALGIEPEIVVVGKGEKQNDNEIEAISGATISSKAIGRLLEKSLAEWAAVIDEQWKDFRKKK